jgi:hypothetical protein
MRFKLTEELNEAFQRAVEAHGGLFRATPSKILQEMRKIDPTVQRRFIGSVLQYRRALQGGLPRIPKVTRDGGRHGGGGEMAEGAHMYSSTHETYSRARPGTEFPPLSSPALSPLVKMVLTNNAAVLELFSEVCAGNKKLYDTFKFSNSVLEFLVSNME